MNRDQNENGPGGFSFVNYASPDECVDDWLHKLIIWLEALASCAASLEVSHVHDSVECALI